MRRALRPSFVVTVSLSVVACAAPPGPSAPSSTAPPTSPSSAALTAPTSAPPATTATSTTPAAAPPAAPTGATSTGGPFRQHPRDAAGRVVYKRATGACFVEIVVSAAERRFRFDDVACPPVMSDPAYQRCENGEIRLANDGCVCARLGNPPRPPVATDCPAH